MLLHLEIADILPAYHQWRLYPEVKRNTLLILKESLNNVVKHSKATEVWVSVKVEENRFTLSVSDNGVGFRLEERGQSGNGLRNMQKRAEEIQGLYEIKTDKGTHTRLEIPLQLEPRV